MEKKQALHKLGHALHDLNPTFNDFSYSDSIKALMREFLSYRKPIIVSSIYNFKPQNIGGEVTLHKDNCYMITDPLSCTTIWIAVDDSSQMGVSGAFQAVIEKPLVSS